MTPGIDNITDIKEMSSEGALNFCLIIVSIVRWVSCSLCYATSQKISRIDDEGPNSLETSNSVLLFQVVKKPIYSRIIHYCGST